MSKKQRKLSYIVVGIYLFLLTWLVLFKFSVSMKEISQISMRNINLIPFKESVIVNGKLQVREIIYNILVFVPLGVYVQIFKPNWAFYKKILPGLVLSFIYETVQFVFMIGASDITDIIGNTLGGIVGIGLCCMMKKLFNKRYISITNVIGIIIESIAFALIILLTITNKTVAPSSDVGDANVEQTIEVQVPFIDLSATTGADGNRLYYADKEKFIFGGYYGLFVYDMTEKEITRAIRLSAIGCDATQGDSACEISVTNDGTKVFLHPMNQAQMYVYHVIDNKMTLEDYNLDGYHLYQNQYSGDEYGKLASYEVDGEVRYVVLVNDMTIGELGYTPDERMSSYQVIFNKQDLNHLHE